MTKIIDLEKIVFIIKHFDDSINQNTLLMELEKRPTQKYGIRNHQTQINFCEKLELIKKQSEYFRLTDSGKKFFQLIPSDLDGSGEKQKLLGMPTQEQKQFLQKELEKDVFKMDYADSTIDKGYPDGDLSLSFQKSEFKKINNELAEFLLDIGLVNEQNDSYKIVESGSKAFGSKICKSKITEYQFLKILEKQREVGKIAEYKTVDYEKERIRKKFPGLETNIKRVSDDKDRGISEGFDVISYSGNKITINHDKFIEVKGTTSSKPIFYWSENEIKTAKKLGEQYWLYIWINVKKADEKLLHKIQNPYKKIYEDQNIERIERRTFEFDLENYTG